LFPEALLVLLVGHSDTHGTVSESKYGKNTDADGDTIVRRVEDQLSKKVKKTPKYEIQKNVVLQSTVCPVSV
jgi:hypothetical protein